MEVLGWLTIAIKNIGLKLKVVSLHLKEYLQN